MNLKKKIAVIGSGFGGLSAAIRLQAAGFDVTIFEKNAKVGGHAYPLKKKGYKFDMGPSLITAPELIRNLFSRAGVKMEKYIELVPLDPYYRIYFHDKTFIDYTYDYERMKEQMAQFNRRDAENYYRFIEASKQIYKTVIEDGLGATPFMTWGAMLSFVPKAVKLKALLPSYTFVKQYFKDFRHRFIFSFHPLFIGGNPFRAPAVYLMIPYLEKIGGVHFTKGGMYTLVQSFKKAFEDLGGSIKTNMLVDEILINNGKASGVRSGDQNWPSDVVISNADFIHTYKNLIKPQYLRKWTNRRLDKLKYSMSAFLIYLGVRKQYPQLLRHTLILSHRYRGLIKDIFDRKILPDDFSIYLHVPTRTDPEMAPEGCDSIYMLIPVANLASDIDWERMAVPFADKVLNFLQDDFGLVDLRKNIEVLEIFTPYDFKRERNSYLGSPWGVEPILLQTAYFRPHNRSEDVKGLYLVGANTHPGAGLPGVMLTAEATEKVILSDIKEGRF